MLRSVKQLYGYTLGALDGEIGRVKGFYFDDKDWVVRYLVADTGSWMPGHKVLISPYALGSIYPGGRILQVRLTQEKVESSPSIETGLPVARQHEAAYYRYHNWPAYWEGPGLWGHSQVPAVPPHYESDANAEGPSAGEMKEPDSRLRSTLEVTGYGVQAADGEIGHVEDFLIEDRNWAIKSLVIATGHWWSGKNVLVSRKSIERVSWADAEVVLNLTKAALMEDPEYEHAAPGSGDQGPRLFWHS
ncbi:MAG: PRC-barrel domain protein [Pedosphaera sp.]|nr:PRC-barrel domain protein [Pedosphaera sp.]